MGFINQQTSLGGTILQVSMLAAHPTGSPWRPEQVNGWAELMAYMAYARHGIPRAAVSWNGIFLALPQGCSKRLVDDSHVCWANWLFYAIFNFYLNILTQFTPTYRPGVFGATLKRVFFNRDIQRDASEMRDGFSSSQHFWPKKSVGWYSQIVILFFGKSVSKTHDKNPAHHKVGLLDSSGGL